MTNPAAQAILVNKNMTAEICSKISYIHKHGITSPSIKGPLLIEVQVPSQHIKMTMKAIADHVTELVQEKYGKNNYDCPSHDYDRLFNGLEFLGLAKELFRLQIIRKPYLHHQGNYQCHEHHNSTYNYSLYVDPTPCDDAQLDKEISDQTNLDFGTAIGYAVREIYSTPNEIKCCDLIVYAAKENMESAKYAVLSELLDLLYIPEPGRAVDRVIFCEPGKLDETIKNSIIELQKLKGVWLKFELHEKKSTVRNWQNMSMKVAPKLYLTYVVLDSTPVVDPTYQEITQ